MRNSPELLLQAQAGSHRSILTATCAKNTARTPSTCLSAEPASLRLNYWRNLTAHHVPSQFRCLILQQGLSAKR